MTQQEFAKNRFDERLRRISAGGPNTSGQVYAGVAEAAAAGTPMLSVRMPRLRLGWMKFVILYPISLAGAFIIGLLAVVMARFVRVQSFGGALAGENADLLMAMDFGLALGAAFVLRWMFKFQEHGMQIASTTGVVLMILSMHNFVHRAPEAFEIAFPKAWVQEVIVTTKADSVLFRGLSIKS